MLLELLEPVNSELQELAANSERGTIGGRMRFYEVDDGVDLAQVDLVILGVRENRNGEDVPRSYDEFSHIRKFLYQLYLGAWSSRMLDLGDVVAGNQVEDTYFMVRKIVELCQSQGVVPVILGGSQDLLYPMYRAFDERPQMVNVCNVDARFKLGDIDAPLAASNFIGKMVVDQPYHLFNYINLGYQTYYNSHEEIALLEQLHFESLRLGEIDGNLSRVEPFLRSSDLVGVDMGSVDYASSAFAKAYPNGINGKQLCSIARYAAMGERCQALGLFNIPRDYSAQGCELISQAIWYFMEGINLRIEEYPKENDTRFISYEVLIEPEGLKFLKSTITDRWWIKVIKNDELHNIKNHHAFIACSQADYQDANQGIIPESWLRARRKLDL